MPTETIILVHGLWMNGVDMSLLAGRMESYGYQTVRFHYPSIRHTPRENASRLDAFCAGINTPIIHFIGHSLGGIVIRHLFFDYPNRKPGRVVTLGTPHRPSRSAHSFSAYSVGRMMLGKSTVDGLLGNIPPWSGTHDLGSIAGTMEFGLGRLFEGLPFPNDGTVTVEETRLHNMKDHVTVDTTHFGLLLSPKIAPLCHNFLRDGLFGTV